MKHLPMCMATLLFITGVQGPAGAADLEFGADIICIENEFRSLTNQDAYTGDKKAIKINSWFSDWLFNDDNYAKNATVTFDWTPWTVNGPVLKIMADDRSHNLTRLMSRTKDSLIAVTSASDPLTAESWLFSLNFPQEAVIATQVQTNVGGMKGKVIVYDCSFNDKSPAVKKPAQPVPSDDDDIG